jgi:putative ABC transport system permease protein
MGLIAELRFAARQLRRSPAIAAAAIVTVALAVGANGAVFSLVRAVLLRPLPFGAADRLVVVWGKQPGSPFPRLPLSYPHFTDLRAGVRSLEALAAWSALDDYRVAIAGADQAIEVRYGVASASLFRVLGVAPALGRDFAADEQAAAEAQQVMVSHRLWATRLGADPGMVGGKLLLDGKPYTVAGVLPAGFRFGGAAVDVWYPLLLDPQGSGPRSRMYARGAKYLGAVGRLAPAATASRARAELAALATRFARDFPHFDQGLALEPVSLREQVVGERRPTLLLLWAAVGAVLLIGCANLVHLQLARGVQRQAELALRGALGAGRVRLARQLFTETLLVTGLGGIAGIGAAALALRLLPRLPLGSEDLFHPFVVGGGELRLDSQVLAFTAAVTLLAALLSGLPPAWRAGRHAIASLRPGAGISRGPRARRGSELLVAGQLALSLVLLATSALLVRSLAALAAVDLGFQPAGVVAVELRLSPAAYATPVARVAFLDALLPRLRALPGVGGASAVEQLPLQGPQQTSDVRGEGLPEPAPNEEVLAHNLAVAPGYLATLRIPLRAGRDLSAADRAGTLPVVLVNETLARRLWPGQEPLGKRLAMSLEALRFRPDGPPVLDFPSAYRTVVGVVADVRQERPERPPLPELYVPFAQRAGAETVLVARTSASPAALRAQVEAVVRELDRAQPVGAALALADLAAETTGGPRLRALLTSLFAGLALLMASVGLYGVLAHAVASQRRELGIRIAVGAGRRQLFALVGGRAGRMVAAGLALGLLAAALLRGTLAAFLFELEPEDPVALLAALLSLAAAATLAVLLPVRRAVRVDPLATLRGE